MRANLRKTFFERSNVLLLQITPKMPVCLTLYYRSATTLVKSHCSYGLVGRWFWDYLNSFKSHGQTIITFQKVGVGDWLVGVGGVVGGWTWTVIGDGDAAGGGEGVVVVVVGCVESLVMMMAGRVGIDG